MALRNWFLGLFLAAAPALAADSNPIRAGMFCEFVSPNGGAHLLVEVKATAKSLAYVEARGGSLRLPLGGWTRKDNLTAATAASFTGLLEELEQRYLVQVTYQTPRSYYVKIIGANPRRLPDHWVRAKAVTKVDSEKTGE